ncbi:hypothetical protein GCM10027259_60450 [Micromonospora palomenae]
MQVERLRMAGHIPSLTPTATARSPSDAAIAGLGPAVPADTAAPVRPRPRPRRVPVDPVPGARAGVSFHQDKDVTTSGRRRRASAPP